MPFVDGSVMLQAVRLSSGWNFVHLVVEQGSSKNFTVASAASAYLLQDLNSNIHPRQPEDLASLKLVRPTVQILTDAGGRSPQ